MLLLIGPFLDQSNQDIFSSELFYEDTDRKAHFVDYDSLFYDLMNMISKELSEFSRTQVLIVPSVKDIHHIFPLP